MNEATEPAELLGLVNALSGGHGSQPDVLLRGRSFRILKQDKLPTLRLFSAVTKLLEHGADPQA